MAAETQRKRISPSIDSLLANLPSENSDTYTIELKKIVLDNDLFSRENDVVKYLNDTASVHRFAAFYALLIICREYNNHSKYNSYVDKYGNEFTSYSLYNIVLSTYFRNKGILGERDEFNRAIKFAEDACQVLPTNLAIKHHYAEIIALVIEENINIDSVVINKAIERLDDVIIAHPKHAKYYCTNGRLIAAVGDYSRGIANIKKALDLEEVEDKDSMIRIGQYNYYLLQIKMMMENNQVDAKIGKFNSSFQVIEHNMDNIKTQYLEYLAFFSSVLAFILVTVNLVSKIDDFNKCAGIIIMFAGALVIVFGVFRMLLYFSEEIKFGKMKIIICYVTGFLFLIGGYLIGNNTLIQWLNL